MATTRPRTSQATSFVEAIRLRIVGNLIPEDEMSLLQIATARSLADPAKWRAKFFEIWSQMTETERLAIVATFFIQLLPGRKILEEEIWSTSLEKLWGSLTPEAQEAVVNSFFLLGQMSEYKQQMHGTRQ